jgi:hypothetical protein
MRVRSLFAQLEKLIIRRPADLRAFSPARAAQNYFLHACRK